MNRLRDDVGEDPVAERGIDMLRAIAPTPAMPELKRKVWGAIQQQRLRAAAPRPLGRLRAAAAVAIVLCLVGTAGAVLSQRWVGRRSSPAAASSATASSTAPARTRARAVSPSDRTAEPAAGPSVTAPAPVEAAPVLAAPAPAPSSSSKGAAVKGAAVPVARSLTRQAPHAHRAGGRAPGETSRREVVTASSAASVRERAEVFDAMVALRRDRDPERAARLLEGYLSAHPHGVLREEAMALGIEAADARGDASAARQLARAYQAAYPGGRFGTFAHEHASGTAASTPGR